MNQNSKNIIRLTESKLRDMIKESVRQVLKEGYYWDGDTEPLERIISACDDIYDNFKGLQSDDYDAEAGMAAFDLFEWAKKVRSEAEKFYRYNTNNISIGEGDLTSC